MAHITDYDYSFCTADCKHADCFRNKANIQVPKGTVVIRTVSDFSSSPTCPYYSDREEDKDDEEV